MCFGLEIRNLIFNYTLSLEYCLTILVIGVAPITQVKHVHNKNSIIQGRSLNVI